MNKGFVIFAVLICLFVCSVISYGVVNSFTPQKIDPSTGQQIQMIQPSGWFTSVDKTNSETNLNNAQANNYNGQAAKNYAEAQRISDLQHPMQVVAWYQLIPICGGIAVIITLITAGLVKLYRDL